MYVYQRNNEFFAQAPGLMEKMCEEELRELGARNTRTTYRGVYFEADHATLYKINYTSRLLSRVLAPLTIFRCPDADTLLRAVRAIHWNEFFSLEHTFAITASVHENKNFTNSLYAAQLTKDGVADFFRKHYRGKRPDVQTVNPDMRLNLRIEKETAVLSLDTSGESLHKRGYRLWAGDAPMQETLAAAIIRLSEWDGENVLWDCMCGSGTIVAEALMHYCRMPAQLLRAKFGLFHLPDFNQTLWKKVKEQSDTLMRPLPPGLLRGSDISRKAIEVARKNLSHLPHFEAVHLSLGAFQEVKEFENGTLLANPPYGIRLGEFEDAQKIYTALGDFLKQKCTGTTAYIYMGDPQLRKSIGLRTSRRVPLVNGKLEGVLVQINSYTGSKKKYYADYKAEEAAASNKEMNAE